MPDESPIGLTIEEFLRSAPQQDTCWQNCAQGVPCRGCLRPSLHWCGSGVHYYHSEPTVGPRFTNYCSRHTPLSGLVCCSICQTELPIDLATIADGSIFCQRCWDAAPRCSYCQDVILPSQPSNERIDVLCSRCTESGVHRCMNCEEWTTREDLCDDCARAEEDDCDDENNDCPYLRDHGCSPNLNFLSLNEGGQTNLFLGVELETDNYSDITEANNELYRLDPNESLFWQQSDGSLDNGIEITSQPCTLQFHREKFPWEKICDIVTERGGKSHSAGTCGLHIHLNRSFFLQDEKSQELAELKLIYLVEKFWEPLFIFSRRTSASINSWAHAYGTSLRVGNESEKIRRLKILKNNGEVGHYCAVNIQNKYTIEIRIFRGTTKVSTLLACLELVDLLARTAKSCSVPTLQHLSWKKFIKRAAPKKYPNLHTYLVEKKLKDTPQESEKVCV